jgi:hypothetical protein
MATPIIGDLIENTIGKGVDALIGKFLPKSMSEADKTEARKGILELAVTAVETQEKNLTDRHKFDMQSDSWLSKNIRPTVLVYLIVAWSVLAIGSVKYTVDVIYIQLLSDMLTGAFAFYFGGRSAEKIMKIWKGTEK